VPLLSLASQNKDIRDLTNHFIDPGADPSPWRFVPQENISSLSTKSNPGFVKITENGKREDIKGILDHPIAMDDYELPWEFQLGFFQDWSAQVMTDDQYNYAFGLNLVVTFSDPSTWPEDRSTPPPDAKSVQLFVVHLGNIGENYRTGHPLIRRSELNYNDPSPEVYLLYGRGDLDESANGNWKMAYTWVGPEPNHSGAGKMSGPADHIIRFRVRFHSPTSLEIGMGGGTVRGWRSRTIGTGELGPITGIWEIGPIISLDDWIADELANELGLEERPPWLTSLKYRYRTPWAEQEEETLQPLDELFEVKAPDPEGPYYIDYCLFFNAGDIEHFSEDFDIPGFFFDSKFHIEGNSYADTINKTGYLTVTGMGNHGGWAICPAADSNLIDFVTGREPPFEMEVAFIPPSSDRAWNLWWNIGLWDHEREKYYTWQPTLKNIPGIGLKYLNVWINDPKAFEIETNEEARTDPDYQKDPAYPLSKKNPIPTQIETRFNEDLPLPDEGNPIYWIIQTMDDHRVRVGYRLSRENPWVFSSIFDTSNLFGPIGRFGYPALVSYQLGQDDMGVGNYPEYMQFHFDYIHFRYGLSE
jgi:hypothetical protein